MSIQNSFLSQAGYGYDTVVAVTQSALNETIRTYYKTAAKKFQPVTCYFVTNPSGSPVQIDRQSLLNLTNQVDPLNIVSWDGSGTMPPDLNAALNAKCCFAFSFTRHWY